MKANPYVVGVSPNQVQEQVLEAEEVQEISSHELLREYLSGEMLLHTLTPAFFWLFAIFEWLRMESPRPPSPLLFSGLAVLGTMYCLSRALKTKRRIKRIDSEIGQ